MFQTPLDQLGFAKAQQITADTGLFTFLDESNVELIVKVLDACGLNGRFWIFGAGLTNLAVKLIVTDTVTGEERIFDNPLGTPYAPIQETTIGAFPCDVSQVAMQVIQMPATEPAAPFLDRRAILAEEAALSFPSGSSCATSANTLCITEGRFTVEIDFETASGMIPGRAQQLTTQSGYFWFLGADNVEVVIKVLNACGLNQRYWVLAAGLTNQGAKITVRDTETGNTRTYENTRGTAFETILDTLVGLPCS